MLLTTKLLQSMFHMPAAQQLSSVTHVSWSTSTLTCVNYGTKTEADARDLALQQEAITATPACVCTEWLWRLLTNVDAPFPCLHDLPAPSVERQQLHC